MLNPLSVAHGADLLHRNKNKLAANMHTCTVLLQREGFLHIETESDRRRERDGGKEKAGRSQKVRKENEMGGRQKWMTTSTCPNWSLCPLSDAPMLGGREERRDRELGTQKAMKSLSLRIFFSPLQEHNPTSDGELSPWATGHVVDSLPGCPVMFFFLSFLQCYSCR